MASGNSDQGPVISVDRIESIAIALTKGAMQVMGDRTKSDFDKFTGLADLIVATAEVLADEIKLARK